MWGSEALWELHVMLELALALQHARVFFFLLFLNSLIKELKSDYLVARRTICRHIDDLHLINCLLELCQEQPKQSGHFNQCSTLS